MGISNFPSPAEGVLPLMVISVVLLKNKLRSVVFGGGAGHEDDDDDHCSSSSRERRVSITRYASLCNDRSAECCVCLCRFGAEEEVSELSCKHFFHKACLDKWFDNFHITCPLCRSRM